uniref:BKRF1 encodes EBNA-1 protein-like n=1 Tax=Oryza sativa subsp. japonica TaxID=39947 RepID=Q6Z1W2_ORYSJ|nr:BKRF1 encodes EBNA-1 protein-like [Oryza sativa Japonica Group]
MRQRRPEAEQWQQRHCCRWGCTSGGLRGKWTACRGRGGDCDAGGGDGTAGRLADAAAGAAGVGRRWGERRRWLETREGPKRIEGRWRTSFYRARRECWSRERAETAPEEVAGGINGGQRRGIKSRRLGTGLKGES